LRLWLCVTQNVDERVADLGGIEMASLPGLSVSLEL